MNSSAPSWVVRPISFCPISSALMPVKWVLSRLAKAGSSPGVTGISLRKRRLFTRLSSVMMTAMKLPASTGRRSQRRTVTLRLAPATE